MKKILMVALLLCFSLITSCEGGSSGGGGGGGDDNPPNPTPLSYTMEIGTNGDDNDSGNYDSPLDSPQIPFNGNEIIYYFTSLNPLAPELGNTLSWDNTNLEYVASITLPDDQAQDFWISVYQPALDPLAPPNTFEPVLVIWVTITNNLTNQSCLAKLVHFEDIDDSGNYQYAAVINDIDPDTSCPLQDEDNRLVIVGVSP